MTALEVSQPNAWVRLVLPLRVGEELIGIWLLGRRDPDDFYSHAEITLIESLANQTAIAMSNILQSEQLRAIYQADANRHEQERINLARDLHDSILNQLAALMMNLDPASVTPNFQKAYDQLTHRLREIVSDLRPPMLNYGLKPAIVELADNLMQLRRDEVRIAVDLQSNDARYAGLTELHLFRIVQEACENALRHGRARNIQIGGNLDAEHIEIRLEDDGVGFECEDGLDFGSLIANRHFGLLGMAERAELIGAEFHIDSAPQAGTHIQITWKLAPA